MRYKLLIIILLLFFCACAHPLQDATPDQLRMYSTIQLSDFELKYGKSSNPGVSRELVRRQMEHIEYLIKMLRA